jgi:hypothetical protein
MDSVIILLLIANEKYDWILIRRFVVGVGYRYEEIVWGK